MAYPAGGHVNYGFKADADDIYVYGGQDDTGEQWKPSNDSLQLGDVIVGGKLALVKKATIVTSNSKKNVAAKMPRGTVNAYFLNNVNMFNRIM